MGPLLPPLAVGVLFGSAVIVRLTGRRHRGWSVSIARCSVGIALGLSVMMAAESGGIASGSLLVADRLGATIAVFVAVMALVIGSFASRSLAVEPRAAQFFAASTALTGSTIALALADRPWVMAVSWTAVSLSTVALIGFDGRPASRRAARRAGRAFVIGDLAVVAACALASSSTDSAGSIRAVAHQVGESRPWVAVGVGAALLIGALVRSAQFPFCGWLASSVEAPTPVSAMLHAGVVNGSAILLIRWHSALTSSALLTGVAVLVAVTGIVVGMAVGRTRPDVKSGLAWTTVAQMGFMTLQCALGLAGVAVVHLIAHGMFKASLFLGSGSGLEGSRSHRHPAQIRPGRRVVVKAGAVGAVVVGAGFAMVRPEFLHHPAVLVPVAFAWATVAYVLGQCWARGMHSLTGTAVVAVGVFAALSSISTTADHWLGLAATVAAPGGARWLGAAAVAAVGMVWLTGVLVQRRFPTAAGRAWVCLAVPAPPSPRRRSPGHVPVSPFGSMGSSADSARRARIRSTITQAAASLPSSRPLDRFVATNPLADLESLPFETAATLAALEQGVRAHWDEEEFRALHRDGRINEDDLQGAISDFVASRGREVVPLDLEVARLRDELLFARATRPPNPEPVLLSERYDATVGARRAEIVDELSSWWAAAYLSDHPAWAMPGRENGLSAAWRSLAPHDVRLARLNGSSFTNVLAALPDRDDDAVMQLLVDLGVKRPDHEAYLRRHLSRRHGWAGALISESGVDGDDVIGYLVIRLSIEATLFSGHDDRVTARRPEAGRVADATTAESEAWRLTVWQDAYERGFRDRLLSSTHSHAAGRTARPSCQAVFCMDPRSEGLRRHLESVGECETIGYAGFFGLPINVADLDSPVSAPSCPIIVEPTATVLELSASPDPQAREKRVTMDHAAHDAFATAKRSAAGPFALAESVGWLSGPWMAARTLAPHATARLTATARRTWLTEAPTSLVPNPDEWWSVDEEVAIAASILRAVGLDRTVAPLVALCGHGSHHVNNLHRSALQCGACGGRGGANNARVAAKLLNDPEIRLRLHDVGIRLPADTVFIAAEHDTTADRVRVFDRGAIPASHLAALERLESELSEAGARLSAERGVTLPRTVGRVVGARSAPVRRRGDDWAQVVPEFGLVGNAAMIIGPRSLTLGADLERRVFLHSYRSEDDSDGGILATILAGPLQVAHGISAQYRLSTVDPGRLGAGTKTAHNLVGSVGVIEGAGGDLRIGLPRESVFSSGGTTHDAMRLLVIIDAHVNLVDQVIAGDDAVARLADNGWIRLAARPAGAEEASTQWVLRRRDGTWGPWAPVGVRASTRVADPTRPSPTPPFELV